MELCQLITLLLLLLEKKVYSYKNKKMIFTIQCDSPALWQTYLSDPASITMEGILIFNKHLLFLLTVIVLFVG